jgi:hypothetical protein
MSTPQPPKAPPESPQQTASTCRWARPTLFFDAPLWFDAENRPWTCVRDAAPNALSTTEACASCPRWEPRTDASRAAAPIDQQPDTRPLMVDWFDAAKPPHETE